MNDTAIQLKVLQLARARGLDPATMDLQTWKALQIEARGVREILRDGAKAVTTRASVIMSLNVVSDEKYAQNEAICHVEPEGSRPSLPMFSRMVVSACTFLMR